MGSEMRNYGWPAIFVRDGAVLLLTGVLTFVAVDNTDFVGRYNQPPTHCSNASWQEILSFFLVLSLSIAFVEGLNWVGWLVKRNLVLRSDSVDSQTEIDPIYGIDMLLPKGWIGLSLCLGLLFTAYGLHGPSPCVPAAYNTTPGHYFAGALALAYGLLLLCQACLDLAWKFSTARSK
jgi:hypothetical protein